MPDQNKTFCPNCNAEIKNPVIGTENLFINDLRVEFINQFTDNNSPKYCWKCSKELLDQAFQEFKRQRTSKLESKDKSSSRIKELIVNVPIVTLQSPQDWKYQSLEIVSAQSVTGTGVFTEIASNWTDFFGKESIRHNEKLKNGEDNCKSILQFQAFKMGGNAILGTDIDYSEAGAGKGMLMVCMAGTAVKITNLDELNYNTDKLKELENQIKIDQEADLEIEKLSKYNSLIPDGL